MTTHTIEFTADMEFDLDSILSTRGNRTKEQVLQQIVERGLYALKYRSERNKRVYAEQKSDREELVALRAQLRSTK